VIAPTKISRTLDWIGWDVLGGVPTGLRNPIPALLRFGPYRWGMALYNRKWLKAEPPTEAPALAPVVTQEQAWSLDDHLARVIADGVHILRHANPETDEPNGHPSKITSERWNEILECIETGFQSYIDADASDDYDVAAYERAWDLLREWFPDLWD
jgi:hypothetical protein